ncbi:AraC family transcriptional regulator [Chryseobacterium viscerum]|uniref:helix-turn-helix domain-containing protein n=1 Tax=Chryseobacterium TaxID=59732 RepID=UPI00064631C3|nr:helix-turn-helix domain-containing protein [Chryseobacterium viscerum]MCW1962113.1 helix-turn-helix domain-containing protein [Chryseobacterium viscerum]WPO93273.1 helix-turn-helix domain-containing protein [Chryseobacterium sp. HR92]
MKVTFYEPVHSVLKNYIQGYYFIEKDDDQEPVKYLTFPDNYFIVSACQDVFVTQDKGWVEITRSSSENIVVDFVFRCSVPTEIFYRESVNEVTIYFKPLGIYHFFNADKSEDLEQEINLSDLTDMMDTVLKEPDRKIQIEILENYCLSRFRQRDLHLAYAILNDFETELSIEEIAVKNKITRQYVNKISQRYLAKPASEFRKIQRFRKVLISNKKSRNLTELSYENLFYDQSHLIKDFKELTKISPGKFFENVDTEQNNVWLFI